MELDMLEKSIRAVESQLSSVKYQLGQVSLRTDELEGFLTREKTQALENKAVEDESVMKRIERQEEMLVDEVYAQVDQDVKQVLMKNEEIGQRLKASMDHNVGQLGEKEGLVVSKTLRNMVRNLATRKTKGQLSLSDQLNELAADHMDPMTGSAANVMDASANVLETERHPVRVTIFGGTDAKQSAFVNVDRYTVFADLMAYIVDYWHLEDGNCFALEANHSMFSGEYKGFSYPKSALVLEELLQLKFDNTKGMGCNGIGESPFCRNTYLLPPLYLVYVGVHMDDDLQLPMAGSMSSMRTLDAETGDDGNTARPSGMKMQLFSRLFPSVNKDTDPVLPFSEFCVLVHDYFEGYYFDRQTLLVFFQEKSTLMNDDKTELIDKESTLDILVRLKQILHFGNGFLDHHKLGKLDSSASFMVRNGEMEDQSDVGMDAERVFEWVASFQAYRDGNPHKEVEIVGCDALQYALRQCLTLSRETVEQWWKSFVGGTDDYIDRTGFGIVWPRIAKLQVETGGNEANGKTIGEAVSPAVVKFEHQSPSKFNDQKMQNSVKRVRTTYATFAVIIALILSYTVVYLNVDPYVLSLIKRMYQKETSAVRFPCFNASSLDTLELSSGITSLYDTIDTDNCLWGFFYGPTRDMYFESVPSLNVPPAATDYFKTLSYNRIVPAFAFLRQNRISKSDCPAGNRLNPNSFYAQVAKGCYGKYTAALKDTSNIEACYVFDPDNFARYESAFIFRDEIPYLNPVQGAYAEYDGSGYVFRLGEIPGGGQLTPEETKAQFEQWGTDIKVLYENCWLTQQTRAVTFNIGFLNANLQVYTNIQFLSELSQSGLVSNRFEVLSFNVFVDAGSPFRNATYVRWTLLFVWLLHFGLQSALTVRLREEEQLSQQHTEDNSTMAKALHPEAKGRPRILDWTVRYLQAVSGSTSLILDLFILIWIGVCLGIASRYVFNLERQELTEVLPSDPWNGINVAQQYIIPSYLDAITCLWISIRMLTWLDLFAATYLILPIIKAAKTMLFTVLVIYFCLLTAATSLFMFLDLDPSLFGRDFHQMFNFLLTATYKLGIQSQLYTPYVLDSPFIYVLITCFNIFVVINVYALVVAVYYYYMSYESSVYAAHSFMEERIINIFRVCIQSFQMSGLFCRKKDDSEVDVLVPPQQQMNGNGTSNPNGSAASNNESNAASNRPGPGQSIELAPVF